MTQMQDIFSPLEDTAQEKGVHNGDGRQVTWRVREDPAESYVTETRARWSYKEAAVQRHQTAQRDQVEWDGKVPYSLINTKS